MYLGLKIEKKTFNIIPTNALPKTDSELFLWQSETVERNQNYVQCNEAAISKANVIQEVYVGECKTGKNTVTVKLAGASTCDADGRRE